MKNKNGFKGIAKWLISAGLKAMVVFGLGFGAFYVYAQITYPPEPYTVTGVVGQFTGVTATPYSAGIGGYRDANDECRLNTPGIEGSHICTAMELINSYNVGNAAVAAQTGIAWFNNGPPAHDSTLVNDCNGWNSVAATQYGSMWRFDEDRSLIMFCNESLPFACCR